MLNAIETASSPVWLLVTYCGLILVASLFGGLIPLWLRLTHTRMQVATSLVAGLMLGVGLLHMLPHAVEALGSADRTAKWMLLGFLVMFFVQRFFHFHHHDVPDEDPTLCEHGHTERHVHAHSHGPAPHDHTLAEKSARQLSWAGAAFGLGSHTLINGFALAASVEAEFHGGAHLIAGVGTFLVIFLHKPFDAMVITTLMTKGGYSRASRHLANTVFALIIPLGVALFHLGASQYGGASEHFLGAALALVAGTFVCIACSDLLPELQFHSHDRLKLSGALLAGLLFAYVIGWFEASGHAHHQESVPGSGPQHELGETNAPAAEADPHVGHAHD